MRSPPLPQPISRTLPRPLPRARPAARAGCPNCVMRTDFTQLLKFLSPMIWDSLRCFTPTSGRKLSSKAASRDKVENNNDKRTLTVLHDRFHVPSTPLGWTLLEVIGLSTWPSFAFVRETLGANAAVIFVELYFILCHGREDGAGGCQPLAWVVKQS